MGKTDIKELDDEIKSCTGGAIIDLTLCAIIAETSVRLMQVCKGWMPPEKYFKKSVNMARKSYGTLVPKWGFINFVAVFEAWMSDILRAILRKYPQKIRKRNIESSIVTESSSYEECLEKLIDIELGGIFYAGPKEATKRLQEITSIDIENIPHLADIFEFKAARDILLHNKGIVNKIYLEKSGEKARAKEGEEIKIDSPTLLRNYIIIRTFITKLSNKLVGKFKQKRK